MAVGLFGKRSLGLVNDGLFLGGGWIQFGTQITGILSVAAFVGITMTVIFLAIDKTMGLRVSREEELRGLDIGEHGLECGQQKGYEETFHGAVTEINLLKKIRLDIAVNADFVEATIAAIIKGARTGVIGDGKIFVTNLEECVRLRTGDRGYDAIG